jgi:hypothetical protein
MHANTLAASAVRRADKFGVQALLGDALTQRWCSLSREQMFGQHAFTQPLDALAAFGLVFGFSHIAVAGGEKLFFLQLDALPRRVAQHAVKAATGKHLRKGQRPVQTRVPLRRRLCGSNWQRTCCCRGVVQHHPAR